MRGCNSFAILIQKNHGSMIRIVAIGRGVRVSDYLRADNASPQPGNFVDGALDLLHQPADVDGCSMEGPGKLLQLSGGA